MNSVIQKIQMYNLNMNYPVNNMSIDNYTNYLINSQMNEFMIKFKKDFNKIFVIDYKDDLISLICYRILKNIQSLNKFEIRLYGKIKNTKKDIQKGEKRIFKFKLNKLIKNKEIVLISPYNILYKIIKTKIKFENFDCITWKPLEKFIPEQIKQIQLFYHLGYYSKDQVQIDKDIKIKQFQEFCDGKNNYLIDFLNKKYNNDIAILKLTGNDKEDQILLNQIEDFDGLIFYYYNEFPQLLNSNFSLYLKNKANIPGYNNINNYCMPKQIIEQYNVKIKYIGNWTIYEKEKFGFNQSGGQ